MAQIVINEISQNYSYNIGTNSFATVAMPITSCWGPGYFDPETYYGDTLSQCEDPHEFMLEHTAWQRFPATQNGLESFVSTYRGPSSVYRRAKDYSYQMAVTLLTAGYDVLVCRLSPGTIAQGQFRQLSRVKDGDAWKPGDPNDAVITFHAKYPGTFGNNLQLTIKKNFFFDNVERVRKVYWSVITHIVDASGVKTSAENISLVFNMENSTDTILHWSEVESNFWNISVSGEVDEGDGDGDLAALSAISTPYPVYIKEDGTEYGPDDPVPTLSILIKDTHYVRMTGGDDIQSPIEDKDGKVARPYSQDATITIINASGSEEQVPVETSDYSMRTFERVIKARYEWAKMYNTAEDTASYDKYPNILDTDITIVNDDGTSVTKKFIETKNLDDLEILFYREWLFTHLVGRPLRDESSSGFSSISYEGIFDLLKDKLSYNPQRVIASGWDDQDLSTYIPDFASISNYMISGTFDPVEEESCPNTCLLPVSPIHLKVMDVAYYGRCATGLLDIPHVVDRKFVHIEDEYDLNRQGYAQKLARVVPYNASLDVNGTLYHTHSALFAPWGQYMFVGTQKMMQAAPSFLALMIQRAQILNQATQYEWALPTNRKHNLRIGKLDYTVPKKVLDKWQKLDGVSVNVITTIPDLGTNLWGNSTLFEVPPATYQALANLSTRYLVNAVENVAYRCGIGITFQYNNEQAYNKFYAGVTPLLDTMVNVGAIEGYRVTMSADINGLDQVNINTVIGKIWLLVNGVINDIYIDLVALPAGAGIDLNSLS